MPSEKIAVAWIACELPLQVEGVVHLNLVNPGDVLREGKEGDTYNRADEEPVDAGDVSVAAPQSSSASLSIVKRICSLFSKGVSPHG
jgi:hypothetical protein